MLGDEICGLLISQIQTGVITLCFAAINSGSAIWRYFRAFAILEHKNFLVLYKSNLQGQKGLSPAHATVLERTFGHLVL